MKQAGLSIDIDSVTSHLAGYGVERAAGATAAYETAVPRALELLHRLGVHATFFLIASEAAEHPEIVRRIVREGHEVASHSLTHRLPFPRERGAALHAEVVDSKVILEELSGSPVVGFRAPSWEFSQALTEELTEAGYSYDASVYPSPMLWALRRSVSSRSKGTTDPATTERGPTTWRDVMRPTHTHLHPTAHGPLAEVPVCVTPVLRIPYYHTLGFLLPGFVQKLIGAMARTRREGVSYCFHAVDFLAVEEDGLDARVARHPGMREPLERKLHLAERAIAELGRDRDVVPLKIMVERELTGWKPRAAPSLANDSA